MEKTKEYTELNRHESIDPMKGSKEARMDRDLPPHDLPNQLVLFNDQGGKPLIGYGKRKLEQRRTERGNNKDDPFRNITS